MEMTMVMVALMVMIMAMTIVLTMTVLTHPKQPEGAATPTDRCSFFPLL